MDNEALEMNLDENEAPEKEIAGESKADKFVRLGTSRVNKALVAISRLEALSGSAYEYTEKQVDDMFGALQAALDNARSKFNKTKKEPNTFSF